MVGLTYAAVLEKQEISLGGFGLGFVGEKEVVRVEFKVIRGKLYEWLMFHS